MNNHNLSSCLLELQSSDSDRQVRALDWYFRLPAATISKTERQAVLLAGVKALEISDNPYPIAERLLRFREEAVPCLSELLTRNTSAEVNTLAALILVNNGSRLGVPALVAEVECGGEFISLASHALANAGFTEHVSAIIDWLRRWPMPPDREFPTGDDDLALSLLDVLNRLQMPLPEDIRQKFSEPGVPAFFRTAIERSSPD